MNVLIVEDDKATVELLEQELAKIAKVTTKTARSKASAYDLVERDTFDLVINDLKIPTIDDAADADQVHGLAVHSRIQEKSRGTPILILTGHATIELAKELYEKSPRCDVWSSKIDLSLTRIFQKTQIRECLAAVDEAAKQIANVESIEVSTGSSSLNLNSLERRVLQLFSRLNHGVNVQVRRLGGGLSGANVFRITVEDKNGAATAQAAAKVGPISLLEDEFVRFGDYVSPLLRPGDIAPVIQFCKAGAGNCGGLFYSLASSHEETLFDVLIQEPARAAEAVRRIRSIEHPWQSKTHLEKRTVGDIRRLFIKDGPFNAIKTKLNFDYESVERVEINVPLCRQHFDLHGLNVLIRNGNEALIIDYGEVGVGPACVDSIILELSALFHPSVAALRETWPTANQAKVWDNVMEFSNGSSIKDFISECRKWTHDVATRDSVIFATAYSYAVRQLKYPGIREDLAVNIASAAHRRLMNR